MKFKTYRKCKKGFFSKNKLHIHFKIYKNKIKDINKIVFDFVNNKFKNIIFNFNNNLKNAFAIVITNFIIIFINNNEIVEQKKIEKITYFINFDYFIIELISKKASNIKLIFKK